MIINEKNFGEFIAVALRAASEYHKVLRYNTCGIMFNKKEGTAKVISNYFYVEMSNLKIEIDIPEDKPFYNVFLKQWTSMPFSKPIEYHVEKAQAKYKFIGKTEYYANNILNIIKKEEEAVLDLRARFVFVQGFLPQGCAAVVFKGEKGNPVFELKGVDKRFVVSQNSTIPKEFVEPGIAYACALNDMGSVVELDVLCKFGKTRSGLYVSEIMYDSKCLPRLNNLEIIHPELTCCSNTLDTVEGLSTMPPIHVGAMILYDLLKFFLLCKSSKFNLHFQENINSDIWMESIPVDEEDMHLSIFLTPYDYYKNIQRG